MAKLSIPISAEDHLQGELDADVSLYVALGGGWTQQDSDKNYKYQLDWWPI